MAKDNFRAGLYRILFHKNFSTGYAAGQMTDAEMSDLTPANSIVSAALAMDVPVSIGSPGQSRITVSRFGGQQYRGRFDLGPGELTDFQIAVADESPLLNGLAYNVAENSSEIAGARMGGNHPRPINLNQIGAIATLGNTSIDRTTGAASREYMHHFMPSLQLAQVPEEIAGIQSSTTNPTNAVYNASPTETARLQNGRLFSALNVGYSRTFRHTVVSPYKNYMLVTVLFDGTDDAFVTPETPLFEDDAVGEWNYFCVGGVPTPFESVVASTKTFTLAAAPAAGSIGVLWAPTATQD